MDEININKNICQLRKAAELTQEALANKLGVSYQAVSKWENGLSCPDITLLPKIAEIFDVSIDALFGLESKAPAGETASKGQLPWPDDEGIYMVVYKGHKLYTDEPTLLSPRLKELPFVWNGPALNVSSVLSVRVAGNVRGDVCAGGSISCDMVGGDVSAGETVSCDNVQGSITAGGSVSCDNVYGSVEAGGNVTCDGVGGNVSAGGRVSCDSIGGDVSTAGHVSFDEDHEWRGVKGSFCLDRDDMNEQQRKKYDNIKNNAEKLSDTALDFADKTISKVEKMLKGMFK